MSGSGWPKLQRALVALGLHPFFVFDRDKSDALAELREVVAEVVRLRAQVGRLEYRVALLERIPDPVQVETLVGGVRS